MYPTLSYSKAKRRAFWDCLKKGSFPAAGRPQITEGKRSGKRKKSGKSDEWLDKAGMWKRFQQARAHGSVSDWYVLTANST